MQSSNNPTFQIPPDALFEGKGFWILSPGEEARHRAVLNVSRRIERDDNALSFHRNRLPEEEGCRLIVFGTSFNELAGYMRIWDSGPSSHIGNLSRLETLGSKEEPLKDLNGNVVDRECLSKYAGYSRYSGQGKVCYLELIYTPYQRQGFGTTAMRFLQSQNYELIELEANGLEEAQFFESVDFIDAQLDAHDGEQLVMVWVNPELQI